MQISEQLSPEDYKEIKRLIDSLPNESIRLEQLWRLMDQVWDDFGCDNQILDEQKINQFYKHPIWILNGLFIEQHEISLQHRHAISDWIVKNSNNKNVSVLDFGGGFGTLARMIANKSNSLKVDIYEPYPSDFAISQCKDYSSINFVSNLNKRYDYLISTDVLEHVSDPLQLFGEMIESVNLNGYLIIANCFYPVIKCHLPATFHFRYSFDQFAETMGLKVLGACKGSHATVYQKVLNQDTIDWVQIRKMESSSKKLYELRGFQQNYIHTRKYLLRWLINDPVDLLKSIKKRFKSHN